MKYLSEYIPLQHKLSKADIHSFPNAPHLQRSDMNRTEAEEVSWSLYFWRNSGLANVNGGMSKILQHHDGKYRSKLEIKFYWKLKFLWSTELNPSKGG